MLDGSRLACDSGGPVPRPSLFAGFVVRLAVAGVLCIGAATKDAFTQSASWLSGLATGELPTVEGYFHRHGTGGVAHWHPWDVEPAAKSSSGGAPGYAPAKGSVHDHSTSPSMAGGVATLSSIQRIGLSPAVESARVGSQLDVRPQLWRVMRPRGPPVV